jgi:hypothetical protein
VNILKKTYTRLISLPDLGWIKEKEGNQVVLWINPERTIALSLSWFKKEPVIPTMKDIQVLRDYYRKGIAASGGGLIEADIVELNSLPAVKTIFKVPQESAGTLYIASLTIPFQNASCVIKIEAPEQEPYDLRESGIKANDPALENTPADPYDPKFKEGALMTKSEEPVYDNAFPYHALSLTRSILKQIEKETVFNPKILKQKAFNK